jgi:hypothetical protein
LNGHLHETWKLTLFTWKNVYEDSLETVP